MAEATTSIRVNTRLADEAKKILGAKSRSEAARIALHEILALRLLDKGFHLGGVIRADRDEWHER
ncbi:MAG: hypothetical protein WA213_04795 [Terriglobales bacterium]